MKITAKELRGGLILSVCKNFREKLLFLSVLTALFFGDVICTYGQQDQITFVAYNLLNYPAGSPFTPDTTRRNPSYRTTISSINPDILVVEEVNSQAGVDGFLSNVMNASSVTYSAGIFINGTTDSENALFYKTGKFHFVSNKPIKTALRDISEFTLTHLLSGDTLRIYAVHLKASSTSSDEVKRANEVDSLRKITNALPLGSNFIVCGDFNFYNSTEPAYLELLHDSSGVEGQFIDPISMTGTWNNLTYAIRHTQSTRTTTYLNDGGSTGGLNDRFDMILYSKAISLTGGMTYVSNSEIPFGNDGNHYNDSINKMPNTAVSQAVANALYNSSDHLPVIANFIFQYGTSAPPDVGVLSLLAPASPICSSPNQSLQVQIKNFSTSDLNFFNNNVQVVLQVTNPSSAIQSFTKTISSGILSANAVLNVTFDSTYAMNIAGTYSFNAHTVLTGDANNANNSMPAALVAVNQRPVVTVSPPGPVSICNGSSVTLTASNANSFLWSNGLTTQAISVTQSGSYSVTITGANGCSATSAAVVVNVINSQANGIVFTETMGSVTSTTAISTHESNNGFDNDNYTMSGNGDIRNTNASTGYGAGLPTASGLANAFLTSGTIDRNFIISGINTSGLTNLQLSFGVFKSKTSASGSDLLVQVSSDGINYSNLSFTTLPTGNGTAIWYYRTASGTIPAVPNLRIQFINFNPVNDSAQYRIDDVKLFYSVLAPVITASGSTALCPGDSVTLTATSGNNYLWSTGATTRSIVVYSGGNYSVIVDCVSSSPFTVTDAVCSKTLNLKVLISEYYLAGDTMAAVIDPVNLPGICDTIVVSLVDSVNLTVPAAVAAGVISTRGNGTFLFSSSVFLTGHKYYIVVKHRNSLETWSSDPLLFTNPVISYDFSRP